MALNCQINVNTSQSAYFSLMKNWISVIFILLTLGCTNSSQHKKSTVDENEPKGEIEIYRSLLKKYPDSLELHQQFIKYLDSVKNYSKAIQEIDQLIQKDSINQGLWYQKGLLAQKTKDTTTAIKSYRMANAIYPNAVYMLSLANLLAEQKNKESLLICNNIKTIFPERDHLADIFFIKGLYYARMANNTKALSYFDSCLITNYRYIEALMEKGFILFDNQQHSAALAIFGAVNQIDPLYADGYFWKAKCFEKNKQIPEAIEQYQKAQSLDPALKEATIALQQLQKK